jgi:hypothetical protein
LKFIFLLSLKAPASVHGQSSLLLYTGSSGIVILSVQDLAVVVFSTSIHFADVDFCCTSHVCTTIHFSSELF